jgi:cytochrome c553
MRALPVLCLLLASVAVHAETAQQIGRTHAAEAAARQAGFTPSAKRGEALFRQRFANNDKMPACTSCHTDSPLNAGQHAVTGKAIRPLAVAANGQRFSDPAKVEKWFRRNCNDTLNRICSAQEKADVMAWLLAQK